MLGRRRLDLLVILWMCNFGLYDALVRSSGFRVWFYWLPRENLLQFTLFLQDYSVSREFDMHIEKLACLKPIHFPHFHFWQLSLCFTIVHKWLWKPLSIMFKNKISNILCFNLILYYKMYLIHVNVYLKNNLNWE